MTRNGASIRESIGRLGPGLVAGAADDDPSAITSFSIAGAQYGNALLWCSWVSWPLMHAVQMMCARVGMVTGRGLIGSLERRFPRPLLLLAALALFLVNTVNIGADLSGMAEAASIVTGLRAWWFVVLFGAGIAYATVRLPYRRIAVVLKWLTLALFAYAASAIRLVGSWSGVLSDALTLHVPAGARGWQVVVALVGATFSPYFFIWQASQEVEEKRGVRGPDAALAGARGYDLQFRKLDVGIGTFFSRLVMFFVILTTSLTLHQRGVRIATAADAAEALRPVGGTFSVALYAIGLLGVGFLVIPVLSASAAYALSEFFGWRHGLDLKLRHGARFYAVILLSTAGGVAMQFSHISSIDALFWSGVVNGVLAPFLLTGVLASAWRDRISPLSERVTVAIAIAAMLAAAILWGQTFASSLFYTAEKIGRTYR